MSDISDNQGGVLVSKALADEWVSTPLAELGEIITGTTPSTKNRNYYGNKYPFITPADIEEAKYVRTAQKWLSADGLEVSRSLPRDTVLFTCIGTIGKMGMTSEELSATNQQINAVICAPTVDPHFLYYSLLFHARDIKQLAAKTTLPIVNKGNFARFCIPLPPPLQQRRIARVLATIQRAIEAQEKVIAAARELKRSLMRHLFTYGPVPITETVRVPLKETEIGPVPEHWEVSPLEKCALVQTGVAKGRRFKGSERTILLPYLRVANVQLGYLDLSEIKQIQIRENELSRYILQGGDVLLTEGGDFDKLGRGFIWRGQIQPCVHQNHIFAVRVNRKLLSPEYFSYLVQSWYGRAYFLRVAHRTTHLACINTAKLKAFPVPIPPRAEQDATTSQATVIDEKIEAEEKRKAALQALFKTMLHHLMTGKIRVKDL